jgi:hypothetical protein
MTLAGPFVLPAKKEPTIAIILVSVMNVPREECAVD